MHQNRITFISLEHDNLSKDFKILHDELNAKQEYEIKPLLFKFQPTFLGQLQYGLACIQQLFVLQSSKLVIIDYNNFVISKFPHRKEVKVLEIWHATAALKTLATVSKGITKLKTTIMLSPTPTFTKEYMPKLSIFLKKMSLLQVFLTMTKSSMTILFKTPKYDFLKSIQFWPIKSHYLCPNISWTDQYIF